MLNWSRIKNIFTTFRQPIGLAFVASVGIHAIVELDGKQKLGSRDISQDWPSRSVQLSGLSIQKSYIIKQADLSKLVAIGIGNLPFVLAEARDFQQSLIQANQQQEKNLFTQLASPLKRGTGGRSASNKQTHQISEPKSELNMTLPIANDLQITSKFGWRNHPVFRRQKNFHTGIDFGAPTGTPVLAVYSGKVESADWRGGYGLTVILKHQLEHQQGTTKKQTLYAHLSKILVKKGELVEPGEVIGHVGSTGYSTGSHLHLELRKRIDGEWKAIDPTPYLKAAIAAYHQEQQRAWFNETILSHQHELYRLLGSFTQSLKNLMTDKNE